MRNDSPVEAFMALVFAVCVLLALLLLLGACSEEQVEAPRDKPNVSGETIGRSAPTSPVRRYFAGAACTASWRLFICRIHAAG